MDYMDPDIHCPKKAVKLKSLTHFDASPSRLLNNQSICQWFEMPWWSCDRRQYYGTTEWQIVNFSSRSAPVSTVCFTYSSIV